MDALRILSDEHRAIEQVLHVLEEIARRARDERRFDAASAREALAFFRDFQDRRHHGKEENALFPLLESRKDFSPDSGPTAVLRTEHLQSRACLRGMDEAIGGFEQGDPAAPGQFVEFAQVYIQLLRDHIQKEDGGLFPRVVYMLTPDEHRELLGAYEDIDAALGTGAPARLQRLADALAERFGVRRVAAEEVRVVARPDAAGL